METIKIKNLEFTDYSLKQIKIRGNFSKDALTDDDMLEIKEKMKKMHYKECFAKIKNKVKEAQEIIIGFVDNFDKIGHEVFPACREAIKSFEPEKIIVETPFVTLEWENGNVEYKLYDSDFTEYFTYDSKSSFLLSRIFIWKQKGTFNLFSFLYFAKAKNNTWQINILML